MDPSRDETDKEREETKENVSDTESTSGDTKDALAAAGHQYANQDAHEHGQQSKYSFNNGKENYGNSLGCKSSVISENWNQNVEPVEDVQDPIRFCCRIKPGADHSQNSDGLK